MLCNPKKINRCRCYLGKYQSLPEQYKAIIHKKEELYTNYTQTNKNRETLNLSSTSQNNDRARRADRLVWFGYHLYEVMIAGSNPARPTKLSYFQKKGLN